MTVACAYCASPVEPPATGRFCTETCRQADERARSNLERLITDQAATIAGQAEAIAAGTVIGSRLATARLILSNVESLIAWIERQGAT